MEQTKEIDLREIVVAILRKIWLVILCAVLVGTAVFVCTSKFVQPRYRASVSIYVNNTARPQGSDGITASNLSASQRLVTTYMTILKSDTVLREVAKQADVGLGAGSIRASMSAAAQNETEVFKVYISHADPNIAAKIANAISPGATSAMALAIFAAMLGSAWEM